MYHIFILRFSRCFSSAKGIKNFSVRGWWHFIWLVRCERFKRTMVVENDANAWKGNAALKRTHLGTHEARCFLFSIEMHALRAPRAALACERLTWNGPFIISGHLALILVFSG